jgi:hypothetical protein
MSLSVDFRGCSHPWWQVDHVVWDIQINEAFPLRFHILLFVRFVFLSYHSSIEQVAYPCKYTYQ